MLGCIPPWISFKVDEQDICFNDVVFKDDSKLIKAQQKVRHFVNQVYNSGSVDFESGCMLPCQQMNFEIRQNFQTFR